MDNLFSFDFIKIDLRLINTEANAKRILEENSIPLDQVNHIKLFEQKETVDILFLDSKTYSIVAFTYKREPEINFVRELISAMRDIDPIKYVKKVIDEELKMDIILEKISARGIESLSKRERDFLDEQSKK
jgi:hypothetical protein